MGDNGPTRVGARAGAHIHRAEFSGWSSTTALTESVPGRTIPIPSFDAFAGTISEADLRFLCARVGRKRWGWVFWNKI